MLTLTESHKEDLLHYIDELIRVWRKNLEIARHNCNTQPEFPKTLKWCPLCRIAQNDCRECPVFAMEAIDDDVPACDSQPCAAYLPQIRLYVHPDACQQVLDGLITIQEEAP